MNPLISMIASQSNSNNPAANMLSKFNEFRRGWTAQSAQAKVNEMIQSGQINAQQYEQARQLAEQLRSVLK